MSKLFSLKRWLTLSEAADHLSSVFNEPVSVADIYRFALDGKLVLSVDFVNHCRAKLGVVKNLEDADIMILPGFDRFGNVPKDIMRTVPRDRDRRAVIDWANDHKSLFESGDLIFMVSGDRISEDSVICYENQISTLSGIWDLPMIGGEILDVQHALQQAVGGPPVELGALDGALVFNPETQRYAKIMEHFSNNEYSDKGREYPYNDPKSYYPAGGLPEDAPIIVRTAALTDFVQNFVTRPAEETEKPISTRERNNLLRVIVGLAKQAKIDISAPGSAVAVEAAVAAAKFDGPKEKAIRAILQDACRIS